MAAKPTELIRKEWNSMTDHYTQSVVLLTTKIYRALLPYLRLSEAQVVVEAACGPGNGVELLKQSLPATAKILANDISASFVEIVRAKGYENVEVVEAVNEALPYADGIADRYVANMSIHIVEFPERMVAEAFRILKPGGIAAFSTMDDRGQSSMLDITMQLREKYAISRFRSPFHISELSAFKQVIKSAGFSRVITFEEMSYIPTVDIDQLEANLLRHPLLVNVYEGLEDGKKETFREDLRVFLHNELQINQKPLGVHARIAIAFKP
jgi:ubiquinone/menaquinone biosynthesis C-methylase UbiE